MTREAVNLPNRDRSRTHRLAKAHPRLPTRLAGAFLPGAFLPGAFLADAFLAGAFLAGAFGDVRAGVLVGVVVGVVAWVGELFEVLAGELSLAQGGLKESEQEQGQE